MTSQQDRESISETLRAFREQYRKDRERREVRGLAEYLRDFPGDERGLAREYLALEGSLAGGPISGGSRGACALAPGEAMGPYRALEEIGRGGQAVVFLAEDMRLRRRVALKVLTGLTCASEATQERFRREAEVASRLHHPGICPVFDAGVEAGVPYIAMQYVEGQSLAHKIRGAREGAAPLESTIVDLDEVRIEQDPVTVAEGTSESSSSVSREEVMKVVGLLEKVARALQAAHEAGVVHRDITPGNIMVTPSGEPVILDFGLARDLDTELQTLTRSGEIFGTPAYMSPEQVSPRGMTLDGRTDVYGLGVVLYECLTLRRPFEGPSRQALFQAILSYRPPDPRRLNPAIPRDLKVVLETALDKDRHRRYQSALALAEDLRRVRAREPIMARPAGPLLRLVRSAQRNPVAAASLVVCLLAVIAGVALGSYLLGVAKAERRKKDVAIAERDQAQAERDRLRAMMGMLEAQNQMVLPVPLELSQEGGLGLENVRYASEAKGTRDRSGRAGIPPPGAAVISGAPSPHGAESADGLAQTVASLPPARPLFQLPLGGSEAEVQDPKMREVMRAIAAELPRVRQKGAPEIQLIERQLHELSDKAEAGQRKLVAVLYATLGDELQQAQDLRNSAAEAYARAQVLYAEDGQEEAQVAVALSRAQVLREAGRLAEAAAELGKVRRLLVEQGRSQEVAVVAHNRGLLLATLGRPGEALSELELALRLYEEEGEEQGQAMVLCNQGVILQQEGRFTESCEFLARGHELGSRTAGWNQDSAAWLAAARQAAALEGRLAALGPEPGTVPAEERLPLARLALQKGRHLTAARLLAPLSGTGAAPAGRPDPKTLLLAAHAAALVGLGEGEEASLLFPGEREEWRLRALAGFRRLAADLGSAQGSGTATAEQEGASRLLQSCLRSPALARLHEGPEFDALPPAERQAWSEIWRELDRLVP